MAGKTESLVGQRFGRWIVIGEPIVIKKRSHSLCKCDCGNEKLILNFNLKNGASKSCGCFRPAKNFVGEKFGKLTIIGESEKIGKFYYALCKCECGNEKKIKTTSFFRGYSKTCGSCQSKLFPKRLRRTLTSMKARCLNKKSTYYKDYGGRGIKICQEWLKDRYSFYNWALENGYNENLTIDRIDCNGNYEPSNCKWSTKKEQANNKRTSIFLTYNNEKKTITDWSEIYNITMAKVSYRYKKGLPFEEIFEINKDGE